MRSTPDNDLPSCAPSGPGSKPRVSRSHAATSTVARIDVVENDGSGPATHARQHGDVLLAVRSSIRDRLTDDSGLGLELPEQPAAFRIDRLEPAVHRAVEDDIACGCKRATPHREIFVDRPHCTLGDRVPRRDETTITGAWTALHFDDGAHVGSARNEARRHDFFVLAQVLVRDVEEARPGRPSRGLPVLAA